MANVVNILTGQYLVSVNTPDYPEDEWLINPDLSLVSGVPECFWEVQAGVVVPMSVEKQDAIRAAQHAGTYYATVAGMADGTPAFWYSPYGGVISITRSEFVFASKTKIGAKSFRLGSLESPDGTIFVPANFLLVSASVSLLQPSTADVTLVLYQNGEAKHQALVTAGAQNGMFNNLSVGIDEGTYLTCEVVSAEDILAPTITYIMHWR